MKILYMCLRENESAIQWIIFQDVLDEIRGARQLVRDGFTPLEAIPADGLSDEELQGKATEVQDKFFSALHQAAAVPDYGF